MQLRGRFVDGCKGEKEPEEDEGVQNDRIYRRKLGACHKSLLVCHCVLATGSGPVVDTEQPRQSFSEFTFPAEGKEGKPIMEDR